MKNNRTSLNTEQAQRLLKKIGDPQFSAGLMSTFPEEDGQASVVQLNLGLKSDIELYEELHNNPDKFEVVQEDDFGGGRGNVKCVVRYVRKGPWKLEAPKSSEKPSSKKSSGSEKKSEEPEERVIGFGAPRRSEPEKTVEKKPTKKKKTPKKKTKKKPAKKKQSPKKSKPKKSARPAKKKKAPKKKRSRS